MLNILLKRTDDFICTNMKNIFEGLEKNYKKENKKINLSQELKNLEFDPFVNIDEKSTSFEKGIKRRLKAMFALFFVLIPLVPLLAISYLLDLQFTYAFLLTFIVAIFAAVRTNKIATRYLHFRNPSS